MTTKEKTLYAAAIDVSNEFLGPAGERFMRRQISTHLGIEPENLREKDFDKLVKWVRLTFAVLTDDANSVNDFANKLLSLAPNRKNTHQARKPTHGNLPRRRGTGENGHKDS